MFTVLSLQLLWVTSDQLLLRLVLCVYSCTYVTRYPAQCFLLWTIFFPAKLHFHFLSQKRLWYYLQNLIQCSDWNLWLYAYVYCLRSSRQAFLGIYCFSVRNGKSSVTWVYSLDFNTTGLMWHSFSYHHSLRCRNFRIWHWRCGCGLGEM